MTWERGRMHIHADVMSYPNHYASRLQMLIQLSIKLSLPWCPSTIKKHWVFTIYGSRTPQKSDNIVQAFQDAGCSGVRILNVCSELTISAGKCMLTLFSKYSCI